jgi:hypothetical protein
MVIKIWSEFSPSSQPVFIMAHMRSGSSLLEHILSSNAEILGAGEQSRIYATNTDLKKGELFIKRINNKLFKPYKYITDQILHKKYTPSLDLIRSNTIKVVFLIRNPEETISSIEKLGGPYGIYEKNVFSSSEYYTNRLEYLVNLSSQISERNQIFITYEELVTETEQTLKKLSSFLELKTNLKKEYSVKQTTGKYGDTSKNIKEGTIINTKKKLVKIDMETKVQLDNLYRETCVLLRKRNND